MSLIGFHSAEIFHEIPSERSSKINQKLDELLGKMATCTKKNSFKCRKHKNKRPHCHAALRKSTCLSAYDIRYLNKLLRMSATVLNSTAYSYTRKNKQTTK